MRSWARLCAVVAVATLALTGCSRAVSGLARPDLLGPGVAVTADGYGILVGDADAPIQLELFTEPQCDHCAHFQATFGDDLKTQIRQGRLAVVYRVLTFFDDEWGIDYSAQVANALFVTATPATPAQTFQTFVETLWANQDLARTDYTLADLAGLATDSGVDPDLAAAIGAGRHGVDATAMDAANSEELNVVSPDAAGTPTVYDLNRDVVVDISDPNWLTALLRQV